MKAVLCPASARPDELELADIPDPQPGRARPWCGSRRRRSISSTPADHRRKYQNKPPFPFSPAAEFAGVVESVGPGVTTVAAGDRVIGQYRLGRAREAVAVPADFW